MLQLTLYTSSCRQEGIAYKVLQWYICRMEAWFTVDLDMTSLKNWDEVVIIFLYKSSIIYFHVVAQAAETLEGGLSILLENNEKRHYVMGQYSCYFVWVRSVLVYFK